MCHSVCDSLMGWSTAARMIPLGISHLCPPCMTVNGKTYGGAGRSGVCVRWEKGKTKRRLTMASPEVTMVVGWHLWGDAARYTGKGKVLWFLARREGFTVRVTFTPHRPKTTTAPHETNSVEKNKNIKRAHLNITWISPVMALSCQLNLKLRWESFHARQNL